MSDLPSVRAAMRRLAREADRVPEDHDYCPVGAVHKADLRECAEAERMLGEYDKALRKMVNTHGAHGPCEGNDCRDCGRAYDAANTLLASQHGASAHSDVVFLLERGQSLGHAPTVWWKGLGMFDFTETAHEARSFITRAEAEKALTELQGPSPKFPFAVVTEHVFLRSPGASAHSDSTSQHGGSDAPGWSTTRPTGEHAQSFETEQAAVAGETPTFCTCGHIAQVHRGACQLALCECEQFVTATHEQRCGCWMTEFESAATPRVGKPTPHPTKEKWLRCALAARTRELAEARAQNASARQLLGHATRDCARDHAIAEAARKALRGTLEDEREMWRLVREETP